MLYFCFKTLGKKKIKIKKIKKNTLNCGKIKCHKRADLLTCNIKICTGSGWRANSIFCRAFIPSLVAESRGIKIKFTSTSDIFFVIPRYSRYWISNRATVEGYLFTHLNCLIARYICYLGRICWEAEVQDFLFLCCDKYLQGICWRELAGHLQLPCYLQFTSIMQNSVLLFPIPFQARHSYMPESLRLMSFKNSTPLFESVLLVSALFHATLGNGSPVKLHRSLTVWPSVTAPGHCFDVLLGWTTRKIEKQNQRRSSSAFRIGLLNSRGNHKGAEEYGCNYKNYSLLFGYKMRKRRTRKKKKNTVRLLVLVMSS